MVKQGTLFFEDEDQDRIEIIKDEGFGQAVYYPNFLKSDEADNFLQLSNSLEQVEWKRENIRVYGQVHPVPRDTAWFSEDGLSYTYSGIPMKPRPYPEFISKIQKKINTIIDYPFNSVLLNRYNDGSDKVSWHSDDEKELTGIVHIASVSLGVPRDFQLRKRPNTKCDKQVTLEHGSLLLMKHPLQSFWDHQVPTRKRETGVRVNMTFRKIAQD